MVALVEEKTRQILESPKSYGAYALSFTNEQTVRDSLCKLADDGIKGKRADMERYFDDGYTKEENRAIAKALIAKSEWTGLAGATTNKLIANLGGEHQEVLRSAMDVTHSMTQSTLQMKKNADKLPEIDLCIKEMKKVMDGRYDVEYSRNMLKDITEGLLPEGAVDEFVNKVAATQEPGKPFGYGVINNKETTTMKLSYASAKTFAKAIQDLGEEAEQTNKQSEGWRYSVWMFIPIIEPYFFRMQRLHHQIMWLPYLSWMIMYGTFPGKARVSLLLPMKPFIVDLI